MRILVIGATGMMGHVACQVLGRRHEVFGTARAAWSADAPWASVLPKERWLAGVDSVRMDSVLAALEQVKPDAVFNCLGIVKQLDEAKNPLLSIETNSLFPHRLALACGLAGTKLVHLSTDCVFSGRKGNYSEADIPDPVDLYGRSKLLGETGGCGALTLRTSIIGRQLKGQTGLVEWLISQRGRMVKGYARAIYSGFTTMALAQIVEKILLHHRPLSGIWHLASDPINKFDLLTRLNARLGLNVTIARDESFACDRSLDGSRLVKEAGLAIPSWDQMIADFE
jgi:dTDP-4-dehydrorhamnose reductase